MTKNMQVVRKTASTSPAHVTAPGGKPATAHLPSPSQNHFSTLFAMIAILLLAFSFAACSSAESSSKTDSLMADTQTIALTYEATADLGQAQAELAQLAVANPEQWLLLTAETAITGSNSTLNAGGTVALVKLAYDLGLRSTAVETFAKSNNLIPQTAAQAVVAQPAQAVAADTAAQSETVDNPATSAENNAPQADTPTPIPATATPAAEATAVPTNTPEPQGPQAVPQSTMNVRAGPGTDYGVVTAIQGGTAAPILSKNDAGDWWQVQLTDGTVGWLYGPLVEISGDTGAVVVAANIPPPPPTNTPVPTVPPAPTNTPVPSGPDFRLIEQRLWDVEENGGRLAGESVNCGEKQVLEVIVLDAGGNRLNGVTVQGVYRNELHVTGEKGDGRVEFVMNVDGDDVTILRDADGREVSSDRAKGLTARPNQIPFNYLIQGRFCRDDATCQSFVNVNGCFGHYSWTAVFQRSY